MQPAAKKIIITGTILALWIGMMGVQVGSPLRQDNPTEIYTSDPNLMSPTPTKAPMSPDNLIKLINRARVSHGLPALTIDPILMVTAQTTADIMAGNRMHGHIGDVKSRVMAAGYGAGDIPWATENFVVLPLGGEGQILSAWADDTHQIPMVDPNYKHVGAGVAVIDDAVYYVLHAAYTSNKIYQPGTASPQGVLVKNLASEYMYPVETVTPRTDGKIIHTVKSGQTLWSIAIAYNTHIIDILQANNLPQSLEMLYDGQELIIPIQVVSQHTPRPTPTLTQMVIPTEQPTLKPLTYKAATEEPTATLAMIASSIQEPVNPEARMKELIQYGIGAAIALGLLLIIIGAITGKKKNQG